jgi:carbonic anhydrase
MGKRKCRAAMVFCMDYRLHSQLAGFLEREVLDKDGVDILRIAGAVKSMVRPAADRDSDFILEQLDTVHRLHGIQQIYLINHEDCGAYGPEDIPDSAEELEVHRRDLLAARRLVEQNFPEVEVLPHFMWLDGRCDPIA